MYTTYLLCIKIFIHIIIDAIVCTVFIKFFIFPQSTHFCCCCCFSLLWTVMYMRGSIRVCIHCTLMKKVRLAFFCVYCFQRNKIKKQKRQKCLSALLCGLFDIFSGIKQLTIYSYENHFYWVHAQYTRLAQSEHTMFIQMVMMEICKLAYLLPCLAIKPKWTHK